MSKETMTSEERVWAATSLEKPDRVPINILSTAAYAPVTGCTLADWNINMTAEQKRASIDKVWDYTGGWDMDLASIATEGGPSQPMLTAINMGVKMRFAGMDLPENYTAQVVEQEIMTREDYDTVAEIGWQRFLDEDYQFRIVDATREEITEAMSIAALGFFDSLEMWKNRGVFILNPALSHPMHPFFRFAMGRSMLKFIEDIYYYPAPVEKALKTATREYIEQIITNCRAWNAKMVFTSEERAEGAVFPLHVFERFWWPYTQEIVDALWSEGIVTWFHLDQCWDKNIAYFRQLPRGSAILALDGMTDIFAAKEVLRGHLCLAGDVHPSLTSLGKPEDVEAYCKKLIDEVGGDGGFILGTGCEMPTAVKLDNWRAMCQTVKNYEFSKR
jgi:uroporphyrinogen-III decarboxylase